MLYKIMRIIATVLLAPFFWRTVIGKENIPKKGGAILALNHRSNWDVVVAAISCPRPLNFMAKKELFSNRLFGWLISQFGAFPLSRGKGDVKAIKTAIGRLNEGKILQLFPEGTRVRNQSDVKAKAGVAMLAVRTKVPVIPGVIVGEYRPFRRIYVAFGKPVSLEQYYGQKLDGEQLYEISEGIMGRIRKMYTDIQSCIESKDKSKIAACIKE